MFITNSKMLDNKILVDKDIGEWLISNKIPLLAKEDGSYVFADTQSL